MEKAFDQIWHAGLVCRLLDSDILRRVVTIIRSFLLNRRFHVSVEGAKLSCRPIAAGVPQGSCLSPSLYSIYTDDVPVAAGCPSLGFPRVYRGSHPVWSDRASGARLTPPLPPSRGLPSPIDKHLHQRVLRERGRSAAPTRPSAAPDLTQRPPRR
ncbi:unnamed protein product [Pieris brassicae]|uniref:Reverse transcriptase domain-containing protein n=1 Tax=Pieris brassicae TaxID=7116 RepID=A0A9P0TKF2_PIEBR|nr:unnamed protein product [Pieris brassicae]